MVLPTKCSLGMSCMSCVTLHPITAFFLFSLSLLFSFLHLDAVIRNWHGMSASNGNKEMRAEQVDGPKMPIHTAASVKVSSSLAEETDRRTECPASLILSFQIASRIRAKPNPLPKTNRRTCKQ